MKIMVKKKKRHLIKLYHHLRGKIGNLSLIVTLEFSWERGLMRLLPNFNKTHQWETLQSVSILYKTSEGLSMKHEDMTVHKVPLLMALTFFYCVNWCSIQDQIFTPFLQRSRHRSVVGTFITVEWNSSKLSELSSFFSLVGIRSIIVILGLNIALFTLRFHSIFKESRVISEKKDKTHPIPIRNEQFTQKLNTLQNWVSFNIILFWRKME